MLVTKFQWPPICSPSEDRGLGQQTSWSRLEPECDSAKDLIEQMLELENSNRWYIKCQAFEIASFQETYEGAKKLVHAIFEQLGYEFQAGDIALDGVVSVSSWLEKESPEETAVRNKQAQELTKHFDDRQRQVSAEEESEESEHEDDDCYERKKIEKRKADENERVTKSKEEQERGELKEEATFEKRPRKLRAALPVGRGISMKDWDSEEIDNQERLKEFASVEAFMAVARQHVRASTSFSAHPDARDWQIQNDQQQWLGAAWYALTRQDPAFYQELITSTKPIECEILSELRERLVMEELWTKEQEERDALERPENEVTKKRKL